MIDTGVHQKAFILANEDPSRHSVYSVAAEERTAHVHLAHIAPSRKAAHAEAAIAVRLAFVGRTLLRPQLEKLVGIGSVLEAGWHIISKDA